jgi:hypothetical protein
MVRPGSEGKTPEKGENSVLGRLPRGPNWKLKAAARTEDLTGLETKGQTKSEPVSELQQENKHSPQI